MSSSPHKILRQVMQLGFDDPNAAYRLQDRISALQHKHLEGIIERVMEEFSVPGEIIRIKSLELDLGSIEDIDIEILLPVLLEQALRDELGQLMIRKQYDPLVEVETISTSEGALEDWLYYLENGIRRWHDNSAKPELATILKGLNATETTKFRTRLMALMVKQKVLERLLREVEEEDMPVLFSLLLQEQATDVKQWLTQVQQQASAQLGTSISVGYFNQVVSQNLVRTWALSNFRSANREQAKALTLRKVQAQLNIAIEAPLPEQGQQSKDGLASNPLKLLQYLLFYGYWPAGAVKPQADFDLGEYIIQSLQQQERSTIAVLNETLAYPTARRRLVYQLKQEQLEAVVSVVFPEAVRARAVFEEWLATLPAEIEHYFNTKSTQQAVWLTLLEASTSTTGLVTVQYYQQQLAAIIAATIPTAEVMVVLQRQVATATTLNLAPATKAFLQQIVQLYQERITHVEAANNKADTDTFIDHPHNPTINREGHTADPWNADDLANHIQSEANKQNKPETPAASAKKQNKDGAVDGEQTEEEAATEESRPKTPLQALVYFLKMGVWPEMATKETTGEAAENRPIPNIVVPEAVLSQLLEESPIAVLTAIFPLLESARVRERLTYQLSDTVFNEVIVAFAAFHPPIAPLNEYYRQLEPLVLAWANIGDTQEANALPDVATTLKTFLLTLLYEEPVVSSLESFIKLFFAYWQQKSPLPEETFIQISTTVLADIAVQMPVIGVIRQVVATAQREKEIAANKSTEVNPTGEELATSIWQETEEEPFVKNSLGDTLGGEFLSVESELVASKVIEPDKVIFPNDSTTTAQNITSGLPILGENTTDEGRVDGFTLLQTVAGRTEVDESEAQPRTEEKKSTANTVSAIPTNETNESSRDVRQGLEERVPKIAENIISDNQPHERIGEQSLAPDAVDGAQLPQNDMVRPTETVNDTPASVKALEEKAKVLPTAERQEQADGSDEPEAEDDTATLEYPLSSAAALPFNDAQEMLEMEAENAPEKEPVRKTLKQKIEQIQRKQLPEHTKQAKMVRPKDPFTKEEPSPPLEDPVFIDNAGMVLLWPFVGRCFSALGYTEKGLFKDMAMVNRAIHLLQYMTTGEEQSPEHGLVLNKILCGLPIAEAVEREVVLTEQEKDEADTMLRAVIGNWDKMNKVSIPAFRDSFLKRSGMLTENEISWILRVDQVSYDMLLDTLPWTIGMIKLRYMEKVLYVEWR